MKLYERKLIDDSDNDVPKDYTIIYKFMGTIFQPILYIEIDVNVGNFIKKGFIEYSINNSRQFLLHKYKQTFPLFQISNDEIQLKILERKHW